MAIFQLFIFRVAEALQASNVRVPVRGELIPHDIDLKETIVLTPEASTISTVIEIIGDILRNVEESIKDLSLTSDAIKLISGFGTLVFLSLVGRVMALPTILVSLYVLAFALPPMYSRNQERVDEIVANSLEAAEIFLEKNLKVKVKLA